MTTVQLHSISSQATLLQALDRLNALSGQGAMTLFVTAGDGAAVGSLTDGDLRRALLRGVALDAAVVEAANRNFCHVAADTPDCVELLRDCRQKGIMLVPKLDSGGKIVDIIDLRKTPTRLPVSAILMAGGKGERLRPLTLSIPKPLLPIEGKAIIDYNVEALAAAGISDIHVTTRYLAEQIHDHFARPVGGVEVRCHREDLPLGTIGAASLVDLPARGDTIVMNSDLLTTISYEELYLTHRDRGADATIAAIPYQVSVPYAILELDGDNVVALSEKPTYSYYANAGIYIFRNSWLRSLSATGRTDATDLIERIIAEGGSVTYYTVKGTWIDVGSPADFRQASELMRHHKSLKIMD